MSNFKFLTFEQLKTELDKFTFKQLHVHHTWKPAHRNFTGSNHVAMQQSMYDYHTKSLGWGNIGQHLTLFPDGKWLTGRPFSSTPASIKGWNTGALAVEMVGNFDNIGEQPYNELGYDELEGEQKKQILMLMKYFIDKYGEASVKFHRDNPTAGKSCPGTSLNKTVMIREAKELDKKPTPQQPRPEHWAKKHKDSLARKGIVIHEERFDEPITRGELFALLDRLTDKEGK